ncbi:MAG TPA: ATP-dependent DNA helicase [Candidatus Dormibacteraeota bacterium]
MQVSPASVAGPLRVLAGPGAGKTRALVELYAALVRDGAPRSRILVLTFSTAAAAEIARRVDAELSDSYDRAWISTFHSFCWRLLREHRPDPDRLLVSGFQEWAAMRRTLDEIDPARLGPFGAERLRRSDAFAQDVLAFVALLKQNLEYPATFALRAETAGSPRMRALAAVYSDYQARLERAGLVDFRDLVAGAVDLLSLQPEAVGFDYVLVDEFQDVDPAQFRLLRLLAPPATRPRLVVFGDPDQSIYGFRGTVPRLLTGELESVYWPATLELDVSHRCPPAILEAAERLLLSTQPQRPPRSLKAVRPPGPAIVVGREGNAVDEAFFAAREIRRLIVEEGRRPSDFAILLRSTASLSAPFEEALRALDVPYEVRGLGALARNQAVRFLLTYLRALAEPDAPDALERLLSSGLVGVQQRTVGRLRRHALEEGRPFAKVVRRLLYLLEEDPETRRTPDYFQYLTEAELESLRAALAAFDRLRRRASELPLAALAYAVLIETGMLRRLLEQGEALAEVRATVQGLAELEEVSERLTGAKPTLAELGVRLEALVARAVDDAEAAPATREAVQVLTVHQSKGLEFPIVFLAGFAHGVFPLAARPHPLLDAADQRWLEASLNGFQPSWPRDESEQLAEEARLAYVGMTRARERLYLTYAAEYDDPAGPSPFLELADPAAEARADTRAAGLAAPEAALTEQEVEALLALHREALTPADRPRLASLGVDLAFVCSPDSGQPFQPQLLAPSEVNPSHFSATTLNDYLKCPRLYWYNHHPGLAATPRTVEMERGSFLHEVLEEFHRREAEWRPLPVEAQRHWLETALQERLEEYLAGVDGVLERKAEEQEVRRILENYVRFATSAQPIRRLGTRATELKFTLQLEGAEIHGKIDRINDTGEGTCEVVDYKTGRGRGADRSYDAYFGPELHDVQLALYYLACREGVGPDGERIQLDPRWLSLWYPKDWVYNSMRQVLFAVGEPAPGVRDWVQKPLGPDDLARGREVVLGAIRRIREGDFRPTPRDVVGTCLSYFGCPHATICPRVGAPVE